MPDRLELSFLCKASQNHLLTKTMRVIRAKMMKERIEKKGTDSGLVLFLKTQSPNKPRTKIGLGEQSPEWKRREFVQELSEHQA